MLNPKPYALLRGAYTAAGYEQVSLGQKIGRCETYMNQRLGGKKPWDEDDMYKIMRLLRIETEDMYLYFPPRGIPIKRNTVVTPAPRRYEIAR